MKKLVVLFIIMLSIATTAAAQTTIMTTAQKVKLTVVPSPDGTIPDGTLMVWTTTEFNGKPGGAFTDVAGEFAVWYSPVTAGNHLIRVSLSIDGQAFGATINITVQNVLPTVITLIASTPIAK